MERKAWLADREHALEEEYFWRKEHELIARLREESRREQERRMLQAQLGDAGERFVRNLQAAGFKVENLGLLYLVPLVDVAWADGAVSVRERQCILATAARRGITPNTPAGTQLAAWLEQCPDRQFFDLALEAIRLIVTEEHYDRRSAVARDLVKCCTKVAEATGETLGLVRISHDERECLTRISQALTEKAKPSLIVA